MKREDVVDVIYSSTRRFLPEDVADVVFELVDATFRAGAEAEREKLKGLHLCDCNAAAERANAAAIRARGEK